MINLPLTVTEVKHTISCLTIGPTSMNFICLQYVTTHFGPLTTYLLALSVRCSLQKKKRKKRDIVIDISFDVIGTNSALNTQ